LSPTLQDIENLRLDGNDFATTAQLAAVAVEAKVFKPKDKRTTCSVRAASSYNPRSSPQNQAFEQRLRELGYVDGQNIALDFRSAEGLPSITWSKKAIKTSECG